LGSTAHHLEDRGCLLLDRARAGAAMLLLDQGAGALLSRGRGAAAAQRGVGEAVEEVGLPTRDHVVPGGMELAVLEGLEAVEGDGLSKGAMRAVELMEELAM